MKRLIERESWVEFEENSGWAACGAKKEKIFFKAGRLASNVFLTLFSVVL